MGTKAVETAQEIRARFAREQVACALDAMREAIRCYRDDTQFDARLIERGALDELLVQVERLLSFATQCAHDVPETRDEDARVAEAAE
jgi:hypothetical protein